MSGPRHPGTASGVLGHHPAVREAENGTAVVNEQLKDTSARSADEGHGRFPAGRRARAPGQLPARALGAGLRGASQSARGSPDPPPRVLEWAGTRGVARGGGGAGSVAGDVLPPVPDTRGAPKLPRADIWKVCTFARTGRVRLSPVSVF